ncbi:unnamed protein product [Caenorhabditis sp. 36 PRJEB53466]|nr:unnamed protein product [Caenorhabditis sp. 36 PRJEB53466]
MMYEDEVDQSYDPWISGLEPEPFETVFQELFSGVKSYMIPDEKPAAVVEPVPAPLKIRCNENLPQEPFVPRKVDTLSQFVPVIPNSSTANITKTRQYPMLRCGHCSETLVSQFALEHHETQSHPELFSWFCSDCNVHFDTLRQASEHSLLTHGDGEMPVFDATYTNIRKQGLTFFLQAVTRRSTDFIKKFLHSREKKTVMTAAYFAFAKCELQAAFSGSIGLSVYHHAKTELLAIHDHVEHEDLIRCMKSDFIYGKHIKRIPLITYTPPTTVYRTLTYNNMPAKGKTRSRAVNTVNTRAIKTAPYTLVAPQRKLVAPYTQSYFSAKYPRPANYRGPQVVLSGPPNSFIRRTDAPPLVAVYPVRSGSQK